MGRAALVAAVVAGMAGPARGQAVSPAAAPREAAADGGAFPMPEVAPAVARLIGQVYLTEAERRALRVEHGVWETGDFAEPRLAGRAALLRGAYGDEALDHDGADAADRAEARWLRGEPAEAIALLEGAATLRAARLRAEALLDLGRADEAAAELERVAARLGAERIEDASELVEGVRALMVRARLKGAAAGGAAEYQGMLDMLGRARDGLNRLSWAAPLAEALLLVEKDNYAEAGAALTAALTLNPRSAEAWALMGRLAVDGFDVDRVEAVAKRLDELAAPGPSMAAAEVRAAIRLRQSEGEAAEGVLSAALAEFPTSRTLRAAHAAAAAGRFDFEEAGRRLEAYDLLAPGSPMAYLAAGRAAASARQYAEAAGYLRVASERWPEWAEPVIELGLSEMQSGRQQAAFDALTVAATLDTLNVRAANSLTLLRELRGYATFESEHFVVRCKPGQDEVLAAEMLAPLERIHARVTGAGPGGIDHAPAAKTTVELYPDHRSFGVRITGMPALHTIAAATGPVIAMEAPRSGAGHLAGPYDWARVVQHEYTHTVTLSRTRNRLPHWFTEASAVYLEDRPRDYSTVQLLARAFDTGTLFDLDEINVMFVRPEKPSDRGQAYAQGHWMYEFMIERFGAGKPLELMDVYASGTREGAAFATVLGVTREEFLDGFKAWAGERLVEWGVRGTAARPTVKDLIAREREDGDAGAESAAGPPDETIDRWLEEHADNPFVLEVAAKRAEARGKGSVTAADVPLLERYAAARPVDPLPHRLLAAMYLAGGGAPIGRDASAAVPHLEYLDVREQNSAGYATELARRYAAMGRFDEALTKAERATQVSPYDARGREFAAGIALRAGARAIAERHLVALTILEPDRPVHRERLEAFRARP